MRVRVLSLLALFLVRYARIGKRFCLIWLFFSEICPNGDELLPNGDELLPNGEGGFHSELTTGQPQNVHFVHIVVLRWTVGDSAVS